MSTSWRGEGAAFIDRAIENLSCANVLTDATDFSEGIIKKIASNVSVVLPLGVVDLVACSFLIIAFGSVRPLDKVKFRVTPNPKNRIILITQGNIEEIDSYTESLQTLRHAKFVWIKLGKNAIELKTFDDNHDLVDTNEVAAYQTLSEVQEKYRSIPNFQGRKIHISTFNFTIYSAIGPKDETGKESYLTGLHLDGFVRICEILNLTPEIHVKDGGDSLGIVGEVVNWESDVAIAGIYMRPNEIYLTEYSYPRDYECWRYLVPRPKTLSDKPSILFATFTFQVWSYLAVAVIVLSFVTTGIAMFPHNDFAVRFRSPFESLIGTLMHVLLLRFPMASEIRGSLAPIFVSTTWFGFLMVSAYTSQLAAVFTNTLYENKPSTPAEMIAHGYKWTLVTKPHESPFDNEIQAEREWNSYHFVESTSLLHRDALLADGCVLGGLTIGKIFFVVDEAPPDETVAGFEVTEDCSIKHFPTYVFAPGSPFVGAVDLVASRMREAGITDRDDYNLLMNTKVLRKFIPQNVFVLTKETSKTEFKVLKMKVMIIPFIILAIGYAMSLLAFLMELSYGKKNALDGRKKYKKPRRRRRKNSIYISS